MHFSRSYAHKNAPHPLLPFVVSFVKMQKYENKKGTEPCNIIESDLYTILCCVAINQNGKLFHAMYVQTNIASRGIKRHFQQQTGLLFETAYCNRGTEDGRLHGNLKGDRSRLRARSGRQFIEM